MRKVSVKKICNNLKDVKKICGNLDIEICGIDINTNNIKSGMAFVAISGFVTDGHNYINDAIGAGAVCVFVEREIPDIEILQVVVDNTRKALADISAAFYDYPSKKIKVVGVTGTNGKTTVAHIVSHVISSLGFNCAIFGTNGIEINNTIAAHQRYSFSGRTTPESHQLQKLLFNLVEDNVEYVVMEVSSHAAYLHRIDNINFDVVAFTNLSRDHLDFHKTMANYFAAKAILFDGSHSLTCVICIDDKWGQKLASLTSCQKCITVGFNKEADITPDDIDIDFPLLGKYNTQNMVVANAILNLLGFSKQDIKKQLQTMPAVEGRLQLVEANSDYKIFVDYAHTPDALYNVISTLKEIAKNRIIVVFGCGGDRDKEKRSQMGAVVSKLADIFIVTTDNPRSEDPTVIIDDIKQGIAGTKEHYIILDRTTAILKACQIAKKDDIILIAGKGHEKYQEIKGQKHYFDDVEQAKRMAAKCC